MVLNTNSSATTNGKAASIAKLQYQKKRQSIDNSMIRFPKLDECAHFHYEFAELVCEHVWFECYVYKAYISEQFHSIIDSQRHLQRPSSKLRQQQHVNKRMQSVPFCTSSQWAT